MKKRDIIFLMAILVILLTGISITGCKKNLSKGVISEISAVPGQVIVMQYQTKDGSWDEGDYIMFSDDKGFNVKVNPLPVQNNYVFFAVPFYIDMVNSEFSSTKVDISIMENNKVANVIENFEIKELPHPSRKPGTVTLAFLEGAIATAEETKEMALLQAEVTNSEVDEELITAMDKSISAYTALENEVKAVIAGTKIKVQFAEVNGKVLEYDTTMLAEIDRLYAALLQNDKGSIQITGSATAGSSVYTDGCSKLEGMTMSNLLSCGTKRMTSTDLMINTADSIGKISKKTSLENFAGVAGPIYFVTHTLPVNLAAYDEDLETITSNTGKDEYEIAGPLRWYYINKISTSMLDIFIPFLGTGIGTMADLMLESNANDAYRGIRLTEMTTRNLARQAMFDDGRLPTQSGLNMIVNDLEEPTKKEKVIPWVKEEPKTQQPTGGVEEEPPTECPYEGTYSGTVSGSGELDCDYITEGQYKRYKTPYTITYNLEVTFKCIKLDFCDLICTDQFDLDQQCWYLAPTHAKVSDPFFDCMNGCTLNTVDSSIQLAKPGEKGGYIKIYFPNWAMLDIDTLMIDPDGKTIRVDQSDPEKIHCSDIGDLRHPNIIFPATQSCIVAQHFSEYDECQLGNEDAKSLTVTLSKIS